eukprot:1327987-Amorphochlora_amoeboformis.AAC.1
MFSSALLGLLYVLQGHVDRPDLGNDLVVVFGEGEVTFFGDSAHGHEERKKAEKGAKKVAALFNFFLCHSLCYPTISRRFRRFLYRQCESMSTV